MLVAFVDHNDSTINFAQRFRESVWISSFITQRSIPNGGLRHCAKLFLGESRRAWKSGDNDSADYALVWHPPVEMLAGRDLKAVFALGAGVDSILSKLQAHPEMLNPSVPLAWKIPVWASKCRNMLSVRCCIRFDVLTIIASSKIVALATAAGISSGRFYHRHFGRRRTGQ